jgi:hypothetical protein
MDPGSDADTGHFFKEVGTMGAKALAFYVSSIFKSSNLEVMQSARAQHLALS